MSRGCFESGSILRRSFPTITSTLRSNGSKRRLAKASSKASRLRTLPGRGDENAQERELAPGQRHRLSRFAHKRAGVEIKDEAREAEERRRLAGLFRSARFRSVAHGRSSKSRMSVYTGWARLQEQLPAEHLLVTPLA